MQPAASELQPFIPNSPMGQMNPLMMFALMKDGSSRNSDLALMMMMMQGQGIYKNIFKFITKNTSTLYFLEFLRFNDF